MTADHVRVYSMKCASVQVARISSGGATMGSKGKGKIAYRPLPEDDPKVRQPDISIARQVLGWEPRVSRTEGLKRTLAYFKKELGVA